MIKNNSVILYHNIDFEISYQIISNIKSLSYMYTKLKFTEKNIMYIFKKVITRIVLIHNLL